MKKTRIITITLIFLLVFSIIGKVYANSSFTITMQASKNKLNKNEEFTVEVKISNIQDEKGIIAIGGEIDYDKNSLTLLKLESSSEAWAKPTYYNESNKFVIDRESLSKAEENIFKMIFKVNEESSQNPKISLKNVAASNGDEDIKTSDTNIAVTINNGSSINPTQSPTNSPTTTPTQSPTATPTQKPTDNSSNNKINVSNKITNNINDNKKDEKSSNQLPYTGKDTIAIGIIFSVVAMLAVVSYIKIKQINKKAQNKN